jgi:fibronectin type 3 domain-containing protein
VDLSWNETSTDVLGFNIYRATIPGGPYALVTAAPVTPSQYLDTQVTAGLSYDYVVTAVSTSEIESDYSAETSTQVPSP